MHHIPVLIFGATGLICGMALAIVAKFFAVREDPRIEQLTALLPGANCGACGHPSCGEYAKAIILLGAPINLCLRGGAATLEKLKAFLKSDTEAESPRMAIVLCQGDNLTGMRKALYNGIAVCQAVELTGGGSKACRYGCLGMGDCLRACTFNAIVINERGVAQVRPELCIGCGKCVTACPRHLIKLVPTNRSVHVLCSSRDRGAAVRKVCAAGCIGCGICAKALSNKGIAMQGALAIVDYSAPIDDTSVAAKCPQKVIALRTGRTNAS
jgi:electron transport complex protein RnfB